ncbi:MAG: hypothetical protein IPJ61_18410 [Tessaracoccus sp.]|uniref:hypothetical protein n=1 Tax=Tessaracoccus sp. TaxID=1971211 RepID=UPI001ECB3D81|nr:hypothetical protein [Tessaracoccus sp.]MBK7822958.1 hypothetical protein [Tessaracoccus sp.]
MIEELVRFTAVRAEWNAQIELRAGVRMHDGTFSVAQPLVFAPASRGEEVRAFAAIEFEEAQRLMDALWQAGVRPTDGTGSTGQLAATQAHLADMRKLVFDLREPTMVRA